MTDNPMSSAHRKSLRTVTKGSGQGAKVDVDCCSIRLSYALARGRMASQALQARCPEEVRFAKCSRTTNQQFPITHDLRPAEIAAQYSRRSCRREDCAVESPSNSLMHSAAVRGVRVVACECNAKTCHCQKSDDSEGREATRATRNNKRCLQSDTEPSVFRLH
jgi:hypothetical protein